MPPKKESTVLFSGAIRFYSIIFHFFIIFDAGKGTEKKQITFAIHCGNSTEQLLKNEHLSPLQTRIYSIEAKINVKTLYLKFFHHVLGRI